MMSTLRLITTLLITVLPSIVLVRDWKYHDKRTKKHHRITRSIILIWLMGSISATYFVWSDSSQIQELIDGKDTLISQNRTLTAKIEAYQGDLRQKDKMITELSDKAKKAERGITSTYDYNGAKRETTKPGHISLNEGPEVNVFKQMQELETQKRFSELITLCEKQIKATPAWLTPYLYLGVALANIGNKNRAIEVFEHVKENSYGNRDYSQVDDFLKKLKNQ